MIIIIGIVVYILACLFIWAIVYGGTRGDHLND